MRWIVVLLLLWANEALAQITFQATVDRTSARVGDQVKLMLELKGAASGVPVPVMPSLTGLELAGGPFRSTELQVINGKMAGSTVYTYVLSAITPGMGNIGPSTLTFKKKQYSTKPITIQVASSGQPAPNAQAKGTTEDAFV
ncbi:BatD family protein, partial [bacterium]|nr:BatD family protein [bacterium]